MLLGVELGATDEREAWLGEVDEVAAGGKANEEKPHLPKPF